MKTTLPLLLRILLITLVCISCTHSKQPIIGTVTDNSDTAKRKVITFDLKKLPDLSIVKLSEIGATEIIYIPLKTTPQNVISEIDNIVFSDNYFLTRDNSSSKAPYLFRYDGSFITEVGTFGRGPNEFTGISDIDINPINESIYIANGPQPKFLVYSKNGEFLRIFKNPIKGEMDFKFTEDGILCYINNSQGNIENSFALIDTTGKIIKKFPNKYPWKRYVPGAGFTFENIFYRFNNKLYKKEIYCDTVFIYNNKVFEPHIIIDVGNLTITQDARENAKTRSDSEVILRNFLSPFNLFEFGDFIYYEIGATINEVHDLYSFIGSKKSNFNALIVPHEGLINDIDGGPNIWPKSIKNDSTIVTWIDAIQFKKHIASGAFKSSNPKNPDKKKELEELAKLVKETDNPILILIKLK